MHLSSDQCRAGRSLLNWTQEELAINACVSRATVTDFEANARNPMKNNLRAMSDCMFLAGIEFISEKGASGVGVRFRDRKLEYTKTVRANHSAERATMQMRYAEEPFICVISLEAIEDYNKTEYRNDDEFAFAISDMLHIILAAVERIAETSIVNGRLDVTSEIIDP